MASAKASGSAGAADDAAVADWQSVAAAVLRVQRQVDLALESTGVPGAWFTVLHQLVQAEDHRLPMSRLARQVSMTTGGFTKLADRMARDGLIDRRGSSDDRRVVHAALTDAGVALALRAAQVYRETLHSSVLAVVSAEDLAGIARVMSALAAITVDVAPAEFTPGEAAGVIAGVSASEAASDPAGESAGESAGDTAAAARRRRRDDST